MIQVFARRNGRLERTEVAFPASAEGMVWLDLLNPTKEEEEAVESCLGMQIPTREEMTAIEESARLYSEGEALVMTAVVIDGVSEGRPARAQVTFVLSPRHLVTVRYVDPVPFRTFGAKITRHPESHANAGDVFASLIENIVERVADVLEIVAADLNNASTAIFFDEQLPRTDRPRQTDDLRKLLIKLGRKNLIVAIARESLHSLGRLLPFARQGAAWIKDGAGARLKAVERDVRSLTAHEVQLSAEIGFLQASTLGLINIEQNAIIKVFSIAAVLFLPPTLVGTIYGMNFDFMPELHWQLGYPLALVMMVISAIAPYWWFKRRGWL